MDTSTLLEIVATRVQIEYENPTQRAFLREIMKALFRLREYEKRDPLLQDNRYEGDTHNS